MHNTGFWPPFVSPWGFSTRRTTTRTPPPPTTDRTSATTTWIIWPEWTSGGPLGMSTTSGIEIFPGIYIWNLNFWAVLVCILVILSTGKKWTLIFLLKFLGFRSNPTKMLFQEEFADQRAEQQTHPGRTVKNTKILWESLIDDLGRSRRIFCSFRKHTEEDEEFPNELISDPAAPSNHDSLMHSPSRQKTKDGNGARANLGARDRPPCPLANFSSPQELLTTSQPPPEY